MFADNTIYSKQNIFPRYVLLILMWIKHERFPLAPFSLQVHQSIFYFYSFYFHSIQ